MSTLVSVNDITAMSYRFAVKWCIPVRELKTYASPDKNISRTLRSNRYQFKNIENLEFTYSLTCGKDYSMRVENLTGARIFQEDALILINDHIYRVKCNPTNTLGRLILNRNVLSQNSFEDKKVTFHCIMVVHAEVKAVVDNKLPIKTVYPAEDRQPENIVECETLLTNVDIYPHGYDAVNEFRYSSRIPDFSVKMAVRIIGEAHKRRNSILKALCSEYLMQNLTTENVAEVLKQSLESDAKDLSQKCADFLSKHCKVVSI